MINAEENVFLKEVKTLLNKEIPILEEVNNETFGVEIKNGHIIKLGLQRKGF
ncbi:MAG: hypothetical protein GF364_03400, partial [Candidatus Lokiarchaeota archaeon]|nr:hypothetical protein [Candidatus Lokiarchaeota archaeon]